MENLLGTSWPTKRTGRGIMEEVEARRRRRRNGENGRTRVTGRPVWAQIAGMWEKYTIETEREKGKRERKGKIQIVGDDL